MSRELVDWEIKKWVHQTGMIFPFDEELLNPASYDVRLSGVFLKEIDISEVEYYNSRIHYITSSVFRDDFYDGTITVGNSTFVKINGAHKGRMLYIQPNDFVLGSTLERFELPQNIRAKFHLKSSRAREGYGHPIAGLCDPGWSGSNLTVELKNATRYSVLPLYEGLLIGQMEFTLLDEYPEKSYTSKGHYNNDLFTQASKMVDKAAYHGS